MTRKTPKTDGKGNCRLCGRPLHEESPWEKFVAAVLAERPAKNSDLSLSDKGENIRQGNEFTHLSKYVDSFNGVSRQLEATYNLMRYLKRLAIELQPKTQG